LQKKTWARLHPRECTIKLRGKRQLAEVSVELKMVAATHLTLAAATRANLPCPKYHDEHNDQPDKNTKMVHG
jgi:hypothetical protein